MAGRGRARALAGLSIALVAAALAALWLAERDEEPASVEIGRGAPGSEAPAGDVSAPDPEGATRSQVAPRAPPRAAPDGAVAPALAPQQASLQARLIDATGAPSPHGHFLLFPLDAAGAPRAIDAWKQGTGDDRGLVRVDGLEPGAWSARFAPTYRAPRRVDLELPPGITDLGDLVFPALGPTSDLTVRLAGPGQTGASAGALHLRSAWGDDVDRWNHIGKGSWMRDLEPHEQVFTFRGLPHGPYTLTFDRQDHAEALRELAVDVPGPEVVLELAEPGPLLRLRLSDDRGEPVPDGRILLMRPGASDPRTFSLGSEVGVAFDPAGPFSWIAFGTGMRPRRGTEADLRSGTDPETGAACAVLDVVLERGTGLVVIARDIDPSIAIPGVGYEIELHRRRLLPRAGVDVFVDGYVAGTTDAQGIALVAPFPLGARVEIGGPGHAAVEAFNLDQGRVGNPWFPVIARVVSPQR